MPVLVSKTFTDVTPESAEHGEAADRGFLWEDTPHTFRELVALMRECSNPSSFPLRRPADVTDSVWFSCEPYTADYETGMEREESIHYSRANDPRALKYWQLAAKAAGLIRA